MEFRPYQQRNVLDILEQTAVGHVVQKHIMDNGKSLSRILREGDIKIMETKLRCMYDVDICIWKRGWS